MNMYLKINFYSKILCLSLIFCSYQEVSPNQVLSDQVVSLNSKLSWTKLISNQEVSPNQVLLDQDVSLTQVVLVQVSLSIKLVS